MFLERKLKRLKRHNSRHDILPGEEEYKAIGLHLDRTGHSEKLQLPFRNGFCLDYLNYLIYVLKHSDLIIKY